MLIQFSIRNFRAFKDKTTLNLIASNYDKEVREGENIFLDQKFNLRILKSAVIYGANASGKSKFLEALMFMRHFIITSSKESQMGDKIDLEPFKLSVETEKEPTEFEVIFTKNNILYRYGFEANQNEIVSEWLFHKTKLKEVELFYRDFQNFEIHPRDFAKGKTLVKEKLIRNNALLISVAAQFNDDISLNIIEWFKNLGTLSGLREEGYEGYTVGKTYESGYKRKILELLKAADLGIRDIFVEMLDTEKLPKNMPKDVKEFILKKTKEENAQFLSDIYTIHRKYDKNKKYVGNVNLSMDNDESFGTQKFYYLTGPILDTLENGYTLIVDELDSKLHPNLVCKLVALFNSRDLNPKNAQLVFNTHDTNLLSSGLFRRDQIWFTEKDKFGEARLYSLADFKSEEVRKTEAFEENYIRGKYGAVPFLGIFDNLIYNKLLLQHEDEE